MLPCKCCQYLMRMMSPLTAGLILALLIAISSSQTSPDRRFPFHPQDYSSHTQSYFVRASNYSNHQPPVTFPSSSPEETKKHVQLPFSKDFFSAHRRTKPPTQLPRHLATNSSSEKVASVQRPNVPEVKLRSKFRVKNGTSVNSTIVYIPRHSRAMGNFSEFPKPADFQPIIVSSHRRMLIDPKHFKVKGNSTLAQEPSSSDSSLKKRDISPRSFPIERRNNHLRFKTTTPSSSKSDKSLRFQNASVRKFNPSVEKNSVNRRFSDSKLFVKTMNERENGALVRKKSTVVQVSPSVPPRSFRPKNRRRERQFDLEVESLPNDKQYSSRIVSQTMPSKASEPGISNQQGKHSKLFEYTYSTGVERDWKPIASLQLTTSELYPVSTLSSLENLSVTDYGLSYDEKKAKNLTIYEILKPKLKSSDFLNRTSPEDVVESGDQGHDESHSSREESSSSERSEVNEIQKGKSPPHNSMVISAGRSDSSYSIEYVVVRNQSVVISPLNFGDSAKNSSHETADHQHSFENSSQTEPSISRNEIGNVSRLDTQTEKYPEPEPKLNEKLDYYRQDESNETQIPLPTDLLRIKSKNNPVGRSKSSLGDAPFNSSAEYIQYDSTKDALQLEESESIRKSKMAADSTPLKNLRLDSKMFYDYFAKKPIGNVTLQDFPYPEFRPGNMFRYSDIYNRKPILDVAITRPPPFVNRDVWRGGSVTQGPSLTPTTFNSLRTSLRVVSTFYPNRMQDVTMKFGNRVESTTSPAGEELPEFHQDDEFDEYRDALEPGFTMEKLAYLLIGTCCGLSILCLLVVVVAIRCRRSIVERRLKAQFKKRMYYHEKMKDSMAASPWQQQMFDHFMYLHRRPGGGDSSCSRSTESCNCRCVTWSLGARNLDSTVRPLFPNRGSSSSYLVGQKKLPFGAASTLRYESMLGRTKRPSSDVRPKNAASPNHSDSSHENDSLDIDSDSREGDGGPKKCTCIEYNVWPMPPPNVPRGFYTVCPGRYNAKSCSQHPPVELRTISRDVPPPVTGSNYLDRSEGVVYWSSNDERLI